MEILLDPMHSRINLNAGSQDAVIDIKLFTDYSTQRKQNTYDSVKSVSTSYDGMTG